MTFDMNRDGECRPNLREWLQCPDLRRAEGKARVAKTASLRTCGSENTSNNVGYDGDIQFCCNDCGTWGTFCP